MSWGYRSFTGKGKLMIAFAAMVNDGPRKSVTVWKDKDWVGVAFERVNTTVVFCPPFFTLDRLIVGSVCLPCGLCW